MLRTGDLLLYNDENCELLAPHQHTPLLTKLTRLLSLLPCTTYGVDTYVDELDRIEMLGTVRTDSQKSLRFVRPTQELLQFRCAAVIVCMSADSAQQEPGSEGAANPQTLVPYVFTVTDYEQLAFQLVEMDTLISNIASTGHNRFAVRQLSMACDYSTPDEQQYSSRLRNSIRQQLLTFYKQVMEADKTEAGLFGVDALVNRFKNLLSFLQTQSGSEEWCDNAAVDHTNKQNTANPNLTVFAAIPAYFALYTLYRVNVLRLQPCINNAVACLQEDGVLDNCLAGGYRFSDELLFKK